MTIGQINVEIDQLREIVAYSAKPKADLAALKIVGLKRSLLELEQKEKSHA